MLVLALDTSTPAVTAGICRVHGPEGGGPVGPDEGAVSPSITTLAERAVVDGRAHGELLTPLIVECLAEAGAESAELDALVVGVGPGPFTGLRVGMATAAAFGDALAVPVYGVCSLDALAARAGAAGIGGELLVLSDARRREAYSARFSAGVRLGEPSVGPAGNIDTAGVDAIVGDALRLAELEGAEGIPSDSTISSPDPAALVRTALGPLLAGAEPEPLRPLYLRRPDAVQPKRAPLSPALRSRAEQITIGPLVPDDAQRCAELEMLLFPGDSPWSARAFLSEISARHTSYLGARAEGMLVAYAGIAMLGPEGGREGEINTIGVDPTYQRRGLGRELLGRLLAIADAEAAKVFLDVRTDNEPAIALYQAHNFGLAGLRRRYYQPSGADAYLMLRPASGGEDQI